MGAVCNGENCPRLLDGFYKTTIEGLTPPDPLLVKVTGTKLEHFLGTQIKVVSKIEYGQFGRAETQITRLSGQEYLNFRTEGSDGGRATGIVYNDGSNAIKVGGLTQIFHLIDDNEAEKIMNTSIEEMTDPVEAPDCPYPLRPGLQGKLVWLTGLPGTGKSTSAQLLSRDHGYVNYEGDAFRAGRNPYVPPNVPNPTLWVDIMQKKLRGGNIDERLKISQRLSEEYFEENGASEELKEKFCEAYFEDISNERARIGGDWVVADALLIEKFVRDLVRSNFGTENLMIIFLTLPKDCTFKRLKQRSDGDENMVKGLEMWGEIAFTPVQAEEECVHTLEIEEQMTGEEVVNKILEIVEQKRKS